jgi:hypothetical protein
LFVLQYWGLKPGHLESFKIRNNYYLKVISTSIPLALLFSLEASMRRARQTLKE